MKLVETVSVVMISPPTFSSSCFFPYRYSNSYLFHTTRSHALFLIFFIFFSSLRSFPVGILWNLSSKDNLKERLARETLPELTEKILIPLSGLRDKDFIELKPSESDIFFNTTGCLRYTHTHITHTHTHTHTHFHAHTLSRPHSTHTHTHTAHTHSSPLLVPVPVGT